jgi:PEP-CTERM motif
MRVRNVLACSVFLAAPVSAQTTIETISFWDGASSIQPLGKPNTATYGQSFTVPFSDNVLQSFSFFLRDLGGGPDLEFQGYIASFNSGNGLLIGPMLFESAVRLGPSTANSFTRYDFEVNGLSLTTGGTYMAFLSASGHFADIASASALTAIGLVSDHYPGGAFWFNNNGDDISKLSIESWTAFGTDLAFEITLSENEPSVVPEPSTVLLMGTGMGILLLGVARRKRRS